MKGHIMFTKKKVVIGVAALTSAFTAFTYINVLGSEGAIMELHPEIPPKIIVKAHRRFALDVLLGKTDIPSDAPDDLFDSIFMTNYVAPLMK